MTQQSDSTAPIFHAFTGHVGAALDALVAAGHLPEGLNRGAVTVESPRDTSHGDLATNAAMVLAKPAGTNPRALATLLVAELEKRPEVKSAQIAGPGFINLHLSDEVWLDELRLIAKLGAGYGHSSIGAGVKVNVEYVSANPTGPMHMGHCRGAVVGDALASLLKATGHQVVREYYVNDAGAQVQVLARSAYHRYLEALGEDVGEIPAGLYPGDYLKPVGARLARSERRKWVGRPEGEWLSLFRARTVAAMLDVIKEDLKLLDIEHDEFRSEAELQASGKPDEAEAWLRSVDLVYDGVLEAPKGKLLDDWEPVPLPLFRSTKFGDDQDRPIKKSDGTWTYFGADLAYHYEKAQRADALVDIWGWDHAGTVKRIKAAVAALAARDGRKVPFEVKLVNMVQLLQNGEPVKMSKRSGNFITLAEAVHQIQETAGRKFGTGAIRLTMLTRKPETEMEFDFAKVLEASKENPVFYINYAYVRIKSVLGKASAEKIPISVSSLHELGEEELALVRVGAQFPRLVEAAAAAREPHRIAFFLADLAAAFHAYWNVGNDRPEKRFIVSENGTLTGARLFLASQIGQIIRNGLAILGVTAVEEM